MKKSQKNLLGKVLLEVAPTLIGSTLKQFGKGGKTKLGVYLIALSTLSIKFFFDLDLPVASANPEVIHPVAKAALVLGTGALGVGIGHDLVKKGKGIFGDIRKLF